MVFAFNLVDKPDVGFDFDTKLKSINLLDKIWFKIRNAVEGQGQSGLNLKEILAVLRCLSDPK